MSADTDLHSDLDTGLDTGLDTELDSVVESSSARTADTEANSRIDAKAEVAPDVASAVVSAMAAGLAADLKAKSPAKPRLKPIQKRAGARLLQSREDAKQKLRTTFLATVDLLRERRASEITMSDIDAYVRMYWLEWHGGSLRLTETGKNIVMQLKREAAA